VISKTRLTTTTSPKLPFRHPRCRASSLAQNGRRAFETSAFISACTVFGRLENRYDMVTRACSLVSIMTSFQRGGSSRSTRNLLRIVPSSRPEGCGGFVTSTSTACPRAAIGASDAQREIKEATSTNTKTRRLIRRRIMLVGLCAQATPGGVAWHHEKQASSSKKYQKEKKYYKKRAPKI